MGSARVATDPIFRLFEIQASVGAAASVARRSPAATRPSAGGPGCEVFDCAAFGRSTGSEQDCCAGTRFTRSFSDCSFDDDLGRVVTLNGLFVLRSDSADVCTGAIPVGASFAVSLSNFTDDVSSPDGSFSRTFQELSETFEVGPDGCTASQPDPFGFGIRGDRRRVMDGELQRFESDGFGNVLVDTQSDVNGLAIAVGSTPERGGCTVAAALNGSMNNADFRVGTQFETDFTDFQVVQHPQVGALSLSLGGTVGTDCLGDVRLSTIEPLRLAPGETCFSAGRLHSQLGDGLASVKYSDGAGLDLDLGGDGTVDRHFATCADMPVTPKCFTAVVGLCGACSVANECQPGLGCFPCSGDCTGDTRRCAPAETSATCADGVF